MKKSILFSYPLLVISFVLCYSISFAHTDSSLVDINNFIKVEKLSSRTIVIKTGVFYFDAVIAIATEKGIVVFDAGFAPSLTNEYLKIIEKEFSRKDIGYLINTHGHWDHTTGNKIFFHAVIIAHENCKTEMEESYSDKDILFNKYNNIIKNLRNQEKESDPKSDYGKQIIYRLTLFETGISDMKSDYSFRYPDMLFNDELTLNMGDVTFKLYYFGKAHSQSDIVIYIPEEKLLIAGDLFNRGGSVNFSQLNAGNINKKDVEQWHKTMQILLNGNYDIERILDGHAAMLTRDDLTSFNSNVEYLWNEFSSGREFSARTKLEQVFHESGLQAMVEVYHNMKINEKNKYFYFERSLVDFGYHLLGANETKGAIEVFKVIVEQFPASWNAYDCLGEAYMKNGDTELAILNYEKSLELNPSNENAKKMLKEL